MTTPLRTTPLDTLHRTLGGRMVSFAGYSLPVQYPTGIIQEHLHTRAAAGLFDVSHMGQLRLTGPGAAEALEKLVPADITGLKLGQTRYTFFTLDNGGILDDLMVAWAEDHLFLVVNASRKDIDIQYLQQRLPREVRIELLDRQALLALQGPKAAGALEALVPGVAMLAFLEGRMFRWKNVTMRITRSGYTGEDGFEISVPDYAAENLALLLLENPDVKPAGLGARDSLRLEAGLCLYGHDISETTTPAEAALQWAIPKRRRIDGAFPGAPVILGRSAFQHRVGLLLEGRLPAREGAPILNEKNDVIGKVTSGGFSPTLDRPIAMGYVDTAYTAEGTSLRLQVRNNLLTATVVPLPFVPHRYHRPSKEKI